MVESTGMLNPLTIVHRRKPKIFAPDSTFPRWETCLRNLAFVSSSGSDFGFDVESEDEIYTGAEAYQFLLETICGLQSPIIGETEVFGQFKAFAAQWVLIEPGRAPLVQRLLNDAKTLRYRYLSHLGTQSYGSWLRKSLLSSRVHVLGAGQLAREVLPYLAKQGEVRVHARRPTAVDFHSDVAAIQKSAFDHGALVVVAPMSSAEIQQWLAGRKPQQIFDLRDNSLQDPIHEQAVPLHAIFGEIESTRRQLLPLIEKIKVEIRVRAEDLVAHEKLRPLGWDDLCA